MPGPRPARHDGGRAPPPEHTRLLLTGEPGQPSGAQAWLTAETPHEATDDTVEPIEGQLNDLLSDEHRVGDDGESYEWSQ
ncbi:hypothetical protein [Streptomyces sp. BK340]|uniref:hypothetical protein n=1 Tax=Streptomyces sp. BK340 TaxID=2572903 RepID=UPI0011A92940|nr:hypothetical protein [Streptomyces sp. BK340]TVZ84837.1 hypothetical protein FB157_120104 [Streptomyces sp. BK340]